MNEMREYNKQYYLTHKQWFKDYREIHQESIAVAQRCYYLEHIEALTEWKRTKVACSCGGKFTLSNKAAHERSNKHLKSMATEIN